MNKEISNILGESSIYTLREFASFIGVANSTGVKKNELIDSIIQFLDTPQVETASKKGRKQMMGLRELIENLSAFEQFQPLAPSFEEYTNLAEKSKELAKNYHDNLEKTPNQSDIPTKPNVETNDFDKGRNILEDFIEDIPFIPSTKPIPESIPLIPTEIENYVSDNTAQKIQMECEGLLEIIPGKNFGFIRTEKFDVYISGALIQKMCLKAGDFVKALYSERSPDKYAAFYIKGVNRKSVDDAFKRVPFENLTATFSSEKFILDSTDNAVRAIDLFAPIGKGQRALIVSPPKSGKTTIIKNLAKAIKKGNPNTVIFILLIDERPEEVTDMQLADCGEVVFSAYDDKPERHIKIATALLERAKRLVENGDDVCILMDSLTRFARALNMNIQNSGRSLSGGMDASALQTVKTFFGSGRNTTDGGSLTLIATALVDTNSRMDDLIFEEFKGTGNSEVVLDRSLSEKRIFPAIDIAKSGTRRDELLYDAVEYNSISKLRKYVQSKQKQPMEIITELFEKVPTNTELLKRLPAWFKSVENRK
ncbi:MAG: transcription termination factor Rho [Bacillota bacterium]